MSECESDVPGLAPYTETVRFLETCADKLETLEQEQGADDTAAKDLGERQRPQLVSVLLKIAIGVIFAYGQSEEVRVLVDPAVHLVSEKAAVAGSAATRAAAKTGSMLVRHTVPAGVSLGEAAASTGKVLGTQALVLGKSIGQTSVEAGRRATAVTLSAGKHVTQQAHDSGKRLVSKLAASSASSAKALVDTMIGPPPEERQAAVGGGHDASARAVYTYVGDRPVGMPTPALPAVSTQAPGSASYFCGASLSSMCHRRDVSAVGSNLRQGHEQAPIYHLMPALRHGAGGAGGGEAEAG